jgi:hypothetical protein
MEAGARREQEVARFEGIYCSMRITRPARDVVVLTIDGSDIGEFADAPFRALEADLRTGRPLELFIDSRTTRGASIGVSTDWAIWLGRHRSSFQRVTMLAGSRFIRITADFVRRFAMLEDIMRVTTDPQAFESAVADATRQAD